jgi:hypothetical protein
MARTLRTLLLSAPLLWAVSSPGCSSDDDDFDDDDFGATYKVTGTVIDFETRVAIDGAATVSTAGLTPPPTVQVTGADFAIDGVPPFSVFHLLAGSPPDYRSTYNVGVVVDAADVDALSIVTIREEYLSDLNTAFGVTPTAGTSVILTRAIDMTGAPRAGVPASAFHLNNAPPALGPYFLDADYRPDPNLTETSTSGYAVFYDVSPGLTTVTAADGSGYTMEMAAAPVAATAITLAEVVIQDGAPVRPENVSFSEDVVPIFLARGCRNCHGGGGEGRDLGGLSLQGADNLIYRELTEELSPNYGITRVDVQQPASSLLLTMPSPQDPPDSHPNVTFASAADPDYQTILAWIEEGAQHN